jgi:hypothetical protein
MKVLSVLLFFPTLVWPLQSIAQGNRVATYQEYERAYLSNDAKAMARWLAPSAELSETLHVAGKSDTRHMSREQLLESMRQVGAESQDPLSSSSQVTISDATPTGFCASATAYDQTVVAGRKYQQREERNACFVLAGASYQVKSHSIDIFYTPLK